jgi:mutator protein MutT
MTPPDTFAFCPRCAAPAAAPGANPFACAACGHRYYFNPSVAAAGFLFDPLGRVLLIRRAKDPQAGKLAVPGGFVDVGETAEEALRRETREEVGLEVADLRYLTSVVNRYRYAGIEYPVCDLVFAATAVEPDRAAALDGVAGFEWRRPREVDPTELAFDSLRVGLIKLSR